MDALKNVNWVFDVAGVLLIAASVFGGGIEISQIKVPALKQGGRIFSALVGIGFIALGLFGPANSANSPAATATPVPPAVPAATSASGSASQVLVTIDTPRSGDTVPLAFTAAGKVASAVPAGYSLLTIMQDDQGDQYQPSVFQALPDGSWEQRIDLDAPWRHRQATIMVVMVQGNPPLEQLLDNADTRNLFQLGLDVQLLAQTTVTVGSK